MVKIKFWDVNRLCFNHYFSLENQGEYNDFNLAIPVVTFLAPLASNFEGLKDR